MHLPALSRNGPARLALLLLAGWLGLTAGCASGPSSSSASTQTAQGGARFLQFVMTVNPNGVIDRTGRGYYIILLNAQGQPIEVTDLDTFTDFIRFDGTNVDWYHRIANQPNPGFTFVQAGSLNAAASVSADGKSLRVLLDVGESTNFINQFIVGTRFTAHALISDNFQNAIIGRALDALGPGPGLEGNSLQTVTVQKGSGAVQPVPPLYPDDPLNDWITRNDLNPDYPYPNFDLVKFEIVTQ